MIDPTGQNTVISNAATRSHGAAQQRPAARRLGGLRMLGAVCCGLLILAQPTVEAANSDTADHADVTGPAQGASPAASPASVPALQMTTRLSSRSLITLRDLPPARRPVQPETSPWSNGGPWLVALAFAIGLVPAMRRPAFVWQRRRSEPPELRRSEPPELRRSEPSELRRADPQPMRAVTPAMLAMSEPLPLSVVA